MNRVVSRSLFLLAIVLTFAGPGCSRRGPDQPPLGNVQGTVTLDGKPFAGVVVVFQPAEGRHSTGVTDSEGKYELEYLHHSKGAKVGTHIVGFATPEDVVLPRPVPKKYSYGKETGLEAEVEPGRNVLDFALTSN